MKTLIIVALMCTALGRASAQWPSLHLYRTATATSAVTPPDGPPQPLMSDARILGTLGAYDANAIEASKLAASKASASSIRDFAATLVKAHQLSLQKNTDLSKRLRIERLLPPDSVLDRLHKASMDQMNLTKGVTFDSAYVQAVISEHELATKVITGTLLPAAKHPSVKGFVQDQLPIVGVHLTRARELLAKP
jgi:putative membrane protein